MDMIEEQRNGRSSSEKLMREFLHDEALAQLVCSDLEQLKYAQILTSLALGPTCSAKNDVIDESGLSPYAKAVTSKDGHRTFSPREKRQVKLTPKIRQLQKRKEFWTKEPHKKAKHLGIAKDTKGTREVEGKEEGSGELDERKDDKKVEWQRHKENAAGKLINETNRKGKRDRKSSQGQEGVLVSEDITGKLGTIEQNGKTFATELMNENNQETNEAHEENAVTGTITRKIDPARVSLGAENVTLRQGKQNEIKPRYACPQCGKIFKTYYTYSIHIRMPEHTPEAPFVCDICGKGFRLSSTLCRHKIIHTSNKPHQCKVCFKNFNRSSTLKMHMRTHSGRKQHACQECGKGFHQKGNLRNHMFVHSGERPFRCESCGRHFNKKSNLKHHLKIHELNGNLACTVCKTMFTRNEELRTHVKNVHCK